MIYEIVEQETGSIIKGTSENGDVLWIPKDPANSDYRAYLESLNDNTVEAE